MIKRLLRRFRRRWWNGDNTHADTIDDEEANLASSSSANDAAAPMTTSEVDNFMVRCRDPIKWERIIAYSRCSDIPLLLQIGQQLVRCMTNASTRDELIMMGCIEVFRGMLTGTTDHQVHELAMTSLAYMSVHPKYRPLLVEKDLLDIVLPNLSYDCYELQLQTVKCVANLSIDRNNTDKVWNKGGLVSIAQLLCLPIASSSLELKAECLSVLACLVRSADIARDLVMIGGLVPIIDCLWLVEGVAYINAPWHRGYDPPRPEEAFRKLYMRIAICSCQCMKYITYYVEAKQLYFDLRLPYVLLSYAMATDAVLQNPASAAVNTLKLTLKDFIQQESNLLDRTYNNLQQQYQMKPLISAYVPISLGGLQKEYVMDRPKFSKFKKMDGFVDEEEELIFGAPTHSTMAYTLGTNRHVHNEFYYPTPPGSAAPSSRHSIRRNRVIEQGSNNDEEDNDEAEDFFPFPSPSNMDMGMDSPMSINLSVNTFSSAASTPTATGATVTVAKEEDTRPSTFAV